MILFSIRFPRVFLGFLVGGCLSLAGLVFQSLLRNPLADPYIIGVAGGCGLAGVSIQMLGIHNPLLLVLCGLLGGLISIVLVERISKKNGKIDRFVLVLAGVVLNAFFASLISLFLFLSGKDMPRIFYWLVGSLTLPETQLLLPLGLIAGITGFILFLHGHCLDLMVLGDFQAFQLGVDPERVKWIALLSGALLTAIAVSLSGMIGFIGMFVPHGVRILLGGNHRILIPICFMSGAVLLMLTDTIARTTPIGYEIPVGTFTAIMGAPFFLWLLIKYKAGHS